jgi:hypothetical protein
VLAVGVRDEIGGETTYLRRSFEATPVRAARTDG